MYAVFYSKEKDGLEPRAGFTVLHELITWLKKQPKEELVWLQIYKFPDGRSTYDNGTGPQRLFAEDFLT